MKIFEGTIISNKMTDTAVVEIVRTTVHPLYKKRLKKSKRYKVDTKGFTVNVLDKVKIVETKPLSLEKHFKIFEIMKEKEVKKEKKK